MLTANPRLAIAPLMPSARVGVSCPDDASASASSPTKMRPRAVRPRAAVRSVTTQLEPRGRASPATEPVGVGVVLYTATGASAADWSATDTEDRLYDVERLGITRSAHCSHISSASSASPTGVGSARRRRA